MTEYSDYAYLIAIAHLKNWRVEKRNELLLWLTEKKSISFAEFFETKSESLKETFSFSEKEVSSIEDAKKNLANIAFTCERILSSGIKITTYNSKEYPKILKKNLSIKKAPSILYTRGEYQILNEQTVAIVGSREASIKSLDFTKKITKKMSEEYKVIISGFAKGVDKLALDTCVENNGKSIIVIPEGILKFNGFKKYYESIVEGNTLVLSTFYPEAEWSVGNAMGRNKYIHGLANDIYVAQSGKTGGTWQGASEALSNKRTVYVRKIDPAEKIEDDGNTLLFENGAVYCDSNGNQI